MEAGVARRKIKVEIDGGRDKKEGGMKPEKMIIIGILILLLSSAGFLSGETWVEKRLTNNSGSSENPTVAASGSNVYVVWQDDTPGNNEVYFKRSTNGGTAWQNSKRLTYNSGSSEAPVLAVSGLNIYVVWHDDTPGNWEIYFMKSADGGASWQAAKRLTHNAEAGLEAAIAVSGPNVDIVWYDLKPGNAEIYFLKSPNRGVSWKALNRLTYNSGSSCCPAITASGSNIYVVWYDSTPGNCEIFLVTSMNGGTSWKTPERLTNNSGDSWNPAVAVSGSNIYVVWQDLTPGNNEIYLTKSTGLETSTALLFPSRRSRPKNQVNVLLARMASFISPVH